MYKWLLCQPVTAVSMAKPVSTSPSGHLSMDSLVEVWRKMPMADFFRHYHQNTMTCCRWNRRLSPGKGNTASHRKVSITSELHVIQKNWMIRKTCDCKKLKKSSHLFCGPNTRLTVLDYSSQMCSLKHRQPKLGDRTHRFSFLAVEAESLLNQLKPITLL